MTKDSKEEKLSKSLNEHQGAIGLIGIVIGFLLYFCQQTITEGYIDEAINSISCMNTKISSIIVDGKEKTRSL